MLFMLLVIKTDINCERTGILIVSWERQGIFRIISCIILTCFIVGALMHLEQFCIIFPIFQGNIGQMRHKETTYKELTQGSYIFRILFISSFWNKEYNHLGYFDITKGFPKQFKTNLQMFILIILLTAIYYLIKIIFIKSKSTIAYIIICIVTIYECFFFMLFPIGDEFNYLESNAFYKYSKYYEVIPLFFLLSALIWIAINNHIIALVNRKLYAYPSRRRDIFTIVVVFGSFMSIVIGICGMMYILIQLLINDITPTLEYASFFHLYTTFYCALIIIAIGSSFSFGHYYFSLVFKPIAYEFCQAVQKNEHYIKSSNNLVRLMKSKKKMKKSNANQRVII